jgi:hypothetical protein
MSQTTVNVTTAQITRLYDQPTLIMPAPGAGLAYIVHQVAFVYYVGTNQPLAPPSGSMLVLQFDSTLYGKGYQVTTTNTIPFINQSMNCFTANVGSGNIYTSSGGANKGLYLSNTIGNIGASGSNSTLSLTLWYDIIGVV